MNQFLKLLSIVILFSSQISFAQAERNYERLIIDINLIHQTETTQELISKNRIISRSGKGVIKDFQVLPHKAYSVKITSDLLITKENIISEHQSYERLKSSGIGADIYIDNIGNEYFFDTKLKTTYLKKHVLKGKNRTAYIPYLDEIFLIRKIKVKTGSCNVFEIKNKNSKDKKYIFKICIDLIDA